MRKIIKLFESGSVSVFGLRGKGKDMLFANVVARRNQKYISNTDYGGQFIKFVPDVLNFKNTWRNFMTGKLNKFVYPFDDGIDIYLADVGVYMPSQYQAELCKEYSHIPVAMALLRQVAGAEFHFNVQSLSRCWDKLRELSEIWIRCVGCWLPFANIKIFGRVFSVPGLKNLVIQRVIIYDNYDSAANRVPPFRLRRPLINPDRLQRWEIQKQNYDISHGSVAPRLLIYFNRSKYNTRIFKEMLENA